MEISQHLLEAVRNGRAVLFLGAGASFGAKTREGGSPPSSAELRDQLVARFLGGGFQGADLSLVAELAISEASLAEVQEFISELLADLEPAPFHSLIPAFKWRGLITTNYDLLIETTYARNRRRLQEVVPILSDRDRIDEQLRSHNTVALLKLHGSVTITRNPDLPLILTVDQYATHRKNRERLFQTFADWAYEYPVVYVGHSMKDSDMRAILLEIARESGMHPRHYLLRPDVHPAEERFWNQRHVTVLSGTFEEFLAELDKLIGVSERELIATVDRRIPVQDHFSHRQEPSERLRNSLEFDLEYVHEGVAIEDGNPKAFYRGFSFRWYPIVHRLDVRRSLVDKILLEVILRPEEDRPTTADFYAIKAEAGAGKSVLLRRLAWESATEAKVFCLLLRNHGKLEFEPLLELGRLTSRRIFLFVDDAVDHIREIRYVIDRARKEEILLTVIVAERTNAWNMECEDLDEVLNEEFILRYLNHGEVEALVGLLEASDSLGAHLERLRFEDRVREFEERAGRQLLVALHEATLGKPLEEILVDEFNEIQPQEARSLYLTVCVLNRLRVPIRAGLIARVHGIRFEDFRQRFLRPLEHVVEVSRDRATDDYYYKARHPEIAQIVFDRILTSASDRFHEISRIVPVLNLSYSSDWDSFRHLMRARSLSDLFADMGDVRALFELGTKVAPGEAFLYQQMAIYERLHDNIEKAYEYLKMARELDPKDGSITHSFAELARARALVAATRLERERFRQEAKVILRPLLDHPQHSRYARHTVAKISIDTLKDLLADERVSERAVDQAIRSTEETFFRALQEYPRDSHILAAEADFGALIRDDQRALRALQQAHETNSRDPYVASRLARVYEERGHLNAALETLKAALASNPGDKQLNFRYARVLQQGMDADADTLAYYFRRAFSPGDKNFEAQF